MCLAARIGGAPLDVLSAPVRWRTHEWQRFAEGAAIVGVAYTLDDRLVRIASRQQNPIVNSYLRGVTHLGGGYGFDVAALLAGVGYVRHDETMFGAGVDALESSVIAAGVVTPAIKRAVGRARPIQGLGKRHFDLFENTYDSFPSGHATNAFAIATAIASRYDNRVVSTIAYGLATSVAVARMHDRVHFASDVIAGAMIGHAVGRSVVFHHKRVRVSFVFVPRF